MDIINIENNGKGKHVKGVTFQIRRQLYTGILFRLQEASAFFLAQGTDSNSSAWQHPTGDANHVLLLFLTHFS